jgi:glycerol-3-phosphate acyltransferase PlsY
MTMQAWAVLLGAYLLGSFPSAYLITRCMTGADIRQLGDGNMGAKNTWLSVGWLPGLVVGVTDAAKGALAVIMAHRFHMPENVVLLAGVCVVLGHDFPLFLGFRGGQGMASMVGVFFILFPRESGLAFLAWLTTLVLTRKWDLSCFVGFTLLPALIGIFGRSSKQILYPVLMLPTIAVRKLMVAWQTRHATAH